MAEKRYFWLKLYDDFFTSKRIKMLRSIAGGDTYTIIYLKMQLKALKTDGYLYFDGVLNNFADELALDLDENPDNVRMTINYLQSVGLLETSDGEQYKLPFLDKCIGSECASTQRSRECRLRKRQQEALQCNNSATHMQQVCNVEIEKRRDREDIEIDKDIDKDTCSEPSKKPMASKPDGTDSEHAFIDIPTNTGEPYYVSVEEVAEYKSLYPAVDVEQELRNMKGWSLSNASKRKTRKGMKRFINSWLAREQDMGGSRSSAPSSNADRFAQFAQNRGGGS